jgi:rhomboid family GlyGly-CTERM serine protease
LKNNILIITIVLLSALSQLSLLSGFDWLQYARADIQAGQWWRFITGNFVHLSWRHFAMNVVALVVIMTLYPNCLRSKSMLWVFLCCCLSVTLGIQLFSPEIQWYVGLSGALHGLLVTLIILGYLADKHWLNLILLVVVTAKLSWEGIMGPLPGSEMSAGGPVVVQAHLYGFLGGLVVTTWIIIFNKNKKI